MPLQAWGSFLWEVWAWSSPETLPGILDTLMGHWAVPYPLWQWRMWMLTWDHPPVWAVKQPTSLFLLLKDLGPGLCPQQLCSSPQSHSTRRLASGGKPAVVGILLPPAHRHGPCPRRGPQPRPWEQLEVARRAGSGLLGPCPSVQGRVTCRVRGARLAQ